VFQFYLSPTQPLALLLNLLHYFILHEVQRSLVSITTAKITTFDVRRHLTCCMVPLEYFVCLKICMVYNTPYVCYLSLDMHKHSTWTYIFICCVLGRPHLHLMTLTLIYSQELRFVGLTDYGVQRGTP